MQGENKRNIRFSLFDLSILIMYLKEERTDEEMESGLYMVECFIEFIEENLKHVR